MQNECSEGLVWMFVVLFPFAYFREGALVDFCLGWTMFFVSSEELWHG